MRNFPPNQWSVPEVLLLALVSLATGLFGWLLSSGRAIPDSREIPENANATYLQTPIAPTQARTPDAINLEFSKRAAFDRIVAQSEPEEHLEELFVELQDLAPGEFPKAIADLMGRQDPRCVELATLVAGYWAERDLEGARAWMLKMPFKSGHYGEFEEEILGAWGRMDPSGMFDWLQVHAAEIQPSRKGDVAYALCKVGSITNPERALAWLHTHQPDSVNFLYLKWAQRDGQRAAASALTETDPTIRASAICTVAEWWAQSTGEVAAAAEWAKALPDPIVSSKALLAVGWTSWTKDPQATADYFTSLPQTNDIRGALKRVAMDWKDIPAALRWSLTLNDDELAQWVLPPLVARKGAAEKIAEVIDSLPEEKRATAQDRWTRARAIPASNPAPAK